MDDGKVQAVDSSQAGAGGTGTETTEKGLKEEWKVEGADMFIPKISMP